MLKRSLLVAALASLPLTAFAQDTDADASAGSEMAESETVEEMASEEETAKVNETLAMIGCEAPQIEKESDDLFEIDDATCEIGQYDIKLNGDYKIMVMSIDE